MQQGAIVNKDVAPTMAPDRLCEEIVAGLEVVLNAMGQCRIKPPEAAVFPAAKFHFPGNDGGRAGNCFG